MKKAKRRVVTLFSVVKKYFLDKYENRKYRKLYPDFQCKTEFDSGNYKFIWGACAETSFFPYTPTLYTANDISIIYNRQSRKYILDIETSYFLHEKSEIEEYLRRILAKLERYMDDNKIDKGAAYKFWMSDPSFLFEAESIAELYTCFRIFIEGYVSVGK